MNKNNLQDIEFDRNVAKSKNINIVTVFITLGGSLKPKFCICLISETAG